VLPVTVGLSDTIQGIERQFQRFERHSNGFIKSSNFAGSDFTEPNTAKRSIGQNGDVSMNQEKKIKTVNPEAEATEAEVFASNVEAKDLTAGTAQTAEQQTLARAQAGDHVAFAQLYSIHKRRVYSLCLRMLGNVAEAEDLTQEAFLQLHRKIATFRGDSAFSTWLHRLTINVVLMNLRRKGLNLISLDEALDPSPEYGPARSFGAPDLRLSGSIDRMTLEKAVEALPAGYRLIFVLHDIEGYEHNEIATMLDCSIGNSKSQLHKARMKLREALRAPAEEVAK
jgi:RNA polymerase sigma-70 factor (ECF subfamily)